MQIAHLISQLLIAGDLFTARFHAGFGSAKYFAFRLLEAWRNAKLTNDQLHRALEWRLKSRFVFHPG